ncbi:MAG: metal ABC transporter permease [Candidatus Binatia bacterium]
MALWHARRRAQPAAGAWPAATARERERGVIESFLSSWPLFHNAYLSGWLIGLLLSLIGVLVVARDQIFLGAAVSQASMLGITVGMWVGSGITLDEQSWWRSDVFHAIMGGVFAVLAALFTTRGGRAGGQETHEAITGWVFLLSISLSILLMSHSPHGLEEVYRLLSSTIIGATRTDVWIFALMAVITSVTLALTLRPALLVVMDPDMARVVGIRVGLWETIVAVWLGLTVGFALRVSGVVYTFACLVLPALIAKSVCREVRSMFVLAPLIAVGTGVLAFVLADSYDYPPGQMAAACLSFFLALAWVCRSLRRNWHVVQQ